MSVHKTDIPIPNPCDAAWDEMHDHGHHRFCDHCTTDVHDLSSLTQEEAMALLEAKKDEHLCVRYAHHEGEVFFKDSTSPVWRLSRQLEGAKALLAAAALVVPMLAAGCEADSSNPDSTPEAVSPITIEEKGASLKPGAGLKPTFGGGTPTTETKPPVEELVGEPAIEKEPVEVEHVKGDIAHEPVGPTKPRPKPLGRAPGIKIGKVMLPEHRKGKFAPHKPSTKSSSSPEGLEDW